MATNVYVLIRATSLVLKEYFFCVLSVLTRLVSLINKHKDNIIFFLPTIYAIGPYDYQYKMPGDVCLAATKLVTHTPTDSLETQSIY